jgi:hypothetical protein
MRRLFLFVVLFASSVCAQQPQTQVAPIFAANSKYTNGVAPGYYPLPGSGLTLNVGAGTAFCSNAIVTYAAGTLTMTASSTNYVYLDTTASCAPAKNTTGFSATAIPIAEVTTSSGAITSVADVRTMFFQAGNGSGLAYTRVCQIVIGDQSSSALSTANIQPQGSLCYIPAASTAAAVIVMADAGASTVEVGYRHNGSTTVIASTLTPGTVSGITDSVACSNTGGTAITIEGHSVTCSTLSNTALAAGDYIETIAGAADGTTKRLSIAVVWTSSTP